MYSPEPCGCYTWRSGRNACLWTVHQSGPPWSSHSVRSSRGGIQPPATNPQWCQEWPMQDFQAFWTIDTWPKDLHIFFLADLSYFFIKVVWKCQHFWWISINLQRFHRSFRIEVCHIYRWEVWCIHRSRCSSPFLAVSHPTHRPVWSVSRPCPAPLNKINNLYCTCTKYLTNF